MTLYYRQTLRIAIALYVLIVLIITADVVDDVFHGQTLAHITVELLVVVCALIGIAIVGKQYMDHTHRNLIALQDDLQTAKANALHWRSQSKVFIQGLGVEIQKQFSRWGLTQAESEIGLLMLKGFSHQEIAELRQASERTVREQARAVYRKAGLHNKAALSAFFLEDLLLPESVHNHAESEAH